MKDGRIERRAGRRRYIYTPRSYCARSEPVVSESCSLKSLVHIYLRLLPIPSLLATMDGG